MERFVAAYVAVQTFDSGHNRLVPLLFLQQRHHDAPFNAVADRIGQCPFQSRTGEDLVRAVFSGQNDYQSRVLLFGTDAVFARQLHAELVGIVTFQLFHHRYHRLHAFFLFQSLQQIVRRVHRCLRQHSVGVAHITPRILQVNHRERFGGPFFGQTSQWQPQQEPKKENVSVHELIG